MKISNIYLKPEVTLQGFQCKLIVRHGGAIYPILLSHALDRDPN